MDGPSIAIVRSSRPWARSLHRYVADYGGAVVRARPLEERQAIEEEYDILLVDDISSFLTHRLMQELHRHQRRVLGVFDSTEYNHAGEHAGRDRLRALGCDEVIEAGAPPEEFVRMIQALAPKWDDNEFDQLVQELDGTSPPAEAGGVAAVLDESRTESGRVVVVVGAAGGAGATELSLELGRIVRRRGEVAVVVDADDVAPSIAQRLGLPLHPNLRAAVDALEHGTGLLADSLMSAPGGEAIVLCGLPHPKDWVALRPDEVLAVIQELSRACHFVIVNVAHQIEDLGSLGGIDRFGVARSVIGAADAIVLVGSSTPVGVSRILDRIAEIAAVAPAAPIHLVINRAPGNQFKRGELLEEIQRTYVPATIHFLPHDRRIEEAAWQGELVEAGPFTQAATEVANDVLQSSYVRRIKPKRGLAKRFSRS